MSDSQIVVGSPVPLLQRLWKNSGRYLLYAGGLAALVVAGKTIRKLVQARAVFKKHARLHQLANNQEPRQSLDLRKEEAPSSPPGPTRSELTAHAHDVRFRDSQGRQVILRGINLSGSAKIPTQPSGATHLKESLADVPISFVGRPLGPTLEDAEEHLMRLRAWGFNFLRLLTTWESVEHEAPGVYDEQYLAYLLAIVRKCHKYGISVFIDPHQDCWSRFSGGDGAPRWTLELLGFDLSKTDQARGTMNHSATEPYRDMVWMSNNHLIVAKTLWTLFFAGDIFCPDVKIQGKSAQEFLQMHYCGAMKKIAEVLKDEPNVLGFDTLNEPQTGFVGELLTEKYEDTRNGPQISTFAAMKLGAGFSVPVDVYVTIGVKGSKEIYNPKGVCCWAGGPESCVWRRCGIYTVGADGKAVILKPEHFQTRPGTGEKVEFHRDCLVPFWCRMKTAVREGMGQTAWIFAEPWMESWKDGGYADEYKPELDANFQSGRDGPTGWVWCPHFYDVLLLCTKRLSHIGLHVPAFTPAFGKDDMLAAFTNVFKRMIEKGKGIGPLLIGEIGIPMDLRASDYLILGKSVPVGVRSCQMLATDALMRALEATMISSTWWNYTEINCNAYGDLWNKEDLSVWSKDQQENPHDLHSGGRGIEALVRPYGHRIAGDPLEMVFDPFVAARDFYLRFKGVSGIKGPTVIFVPQYQYPNGVDVQVSDGSFELKWDEQTLLYNHEDIECEHWIRIAHKA